jgi:hypothetical protein
MFHIVHIIADKLLLSKQLSLYIIEQVRHVNLDLFWLRSQQLALGKKLGTYAVKTNNREIQKLNIVISFYEAVMWDLKVSLWEV